MSRTIILKPFKDSDAEKIVNWIKDEFSFRQWSADIYGDYPIMPEVIIANYNKRKKAGAFFPFGAYEDGNLIGHLIMRFNNGGGEVRFGFIIVDTESRGGGYGKAMLKSAVEYAMTNFNAEKITLGVFENNPSAYHCYRAAGFCEDGEPKFYTINNEKWKCIEMKFQKNSG